MFRLFTAVIYILSLDNDNVHDGELKKLKYEKENYLQNKTNNKKHLHVGS